jgi:hypothetical protein
MQNMLHLKQHLLAEALKKVARRMPPDAKLGFSQGAITPAQLAEEIESGTPRGVHFFQGFEAVRDAQHQTFTQALREFVEKPHISAKRKSDPGYH